MHSVQGGYTDKALSYADKAMQLLAQDNQGQSAHSNQCCSDKCAYCVQLECTVVQGNFRCTCKIQACMVLWLRLEARISIVDNLSLHMMTITMLAMIGNLND